VTSVAEFHQDLQTLLGGIAASACASALSASSKLANTVGLCDAGLQRGVATADHY
jgi:hypothetical protein